MGVAHFSAAAVALGTAAVLVATGATASVPAAVHAQRQTVAPVVTAPCVPNTGGAHGVLPTPPLVDTWTLPNRAFTMRVVEFTQSGGAKKLYCYRLAGGAAQYVEAPTIRVKAGDAFTMRLEDRIPGAPATAAPSPAPSDDGCAQLPYEEPMPAQTAAGYMGRPRIAASMPPTAMHGDDTNFHTHGWHVDPNVDNVFKSLALSPGKACTYTFRVPRSQPPGTYWYHAHLHGLAQNQVGGGLGGTLIVLPPDDEKTDDFADTVLLVKSDNAPAAAAAAMTGMQAMAGMEAVPSTQRERAHYGKLFAIAHPGAVGTAHPFADPFNPPAEPSSLAFPVAPATPLPYCLPPSAGDDPLTINGLGVPSDPRSPAVPRVTQLANMPRRYRLVNASADSFLNVAMIDARRQRVRLQVLARDGVPVGWNPNDPTHPNLRAFVLRDHVMLPPSGRVDLLVDTVLGDQTIVGLQGTAATAPPGGTPFCTGYFGFAMPPRGLVRIHAAHALAGAAKPVARAAVTALATTAGDVFARKAAVTNRRAITFTQYGDAALGGSWYVTETSKARWREQPFWLQPWPGGSATYLPTIRVKQGSVEEWTLINASPEIHAFHIHQLTFVAQQSAYEPTQARVYLDSIALPAAQIQSGQPRTAYPLLVPSKTVVKIDFTHVDKGLFVFHCHMLYHEDHGMMGIVEVY